MHSKRKICQQGVVVSNQREIVRVLVKIEMLHLRVCHNTGIQLMFMQYLVTCDYWYTPTMCLWVSRERGKVRVLIQAECDVCMCHVTQTSNFNKQPSGTSYRCPVCLCKVQAAELFCSRVFCVERRVPLLIACASHQIAYKRKNLSFTR